MHLTIVNELLFVETLGHAIQIFWNIFYTLESKQTIVCVIF